MHLKANNSQYHIEWWYSLIFLKKILLANICPYEKVNQNQKNIFCARGKKETRSYWDSNSDRWIQSPECWPLHHKTAYVSFDLLLRYVFSCAKTVVGERWLFATVQGTKSFENYWNFFSSTLQLFTTLEPFFPVLIPLINRIFSMPKNLYGIGWAHEGAHLRKRKESNDILYTILW